MKWFFALNDEGDSYDELAKMAQVAVHTALKYTSLEPHLIYDGRDEALVDWMKKRNVNVIRRRSFIYDQLREIAVRRDNMNIMGIGAGTFLRIEIPALCEELGFDDEYVFYTDIDVMFLGNVSELEKLTPKYFAVAPEFHKHDYKSMNAGVMLMNIPALRELDPAFKEFIRKNVEPLVDNTWDQTAFKQFFAGRFFGYKWNKLGLEYNWKTYWEGYRGRAKVLHFHGPKPHQRPLFKGEETDPRWKPLLPLLTKQYDELCLVWDKYYLEAVNET